MSLFSRCLFTVFFIFNCSIYAVNKNHNKTGGIIQKQIVKTIEQKAIENELYRLKKEDSYSNLSRIAELNSGLEKLNGFNRTIIASNYGGTFHLTEQPVPFTGGGDFIQNRKIYNNLGVVNGIAAAIEQRGPTAGKIWVVTVYTSDTAHPDTLRVFYSVNGGQSWTQYTPGNIRPYDKLNPDDLDMELIENTTGQKYLWVTFGYRQNKGTGAWAAGGFALQIPSLNGTFFNILNWPGIDSAKRYYNIRITSDNARYLNTPYIYIVCSFDSLNANGVRISSQKFARCLTPYNISTINFSFMGKNYFWYDTTATAGYQRTVYSDIAYFNNGGNDSIEVVFSGGRDSTKLYFSKSDINGNPPVSSTGAGGPVGGSEAGDYKTFARLTSNGNDNGSVICTFRQKTGSNWYVKWFSSVSYGNFGSTFNESALWGSTVNTNYHPDAVGVRNGNTHYISFFTAQPADSIHYISVRSTGVTNHVPKMNYYSSSGEISPKPLFRYIDNDSCFLIYTEPGPANLISAAGCMGEPIGIKGISSPAEYALYQNYPNPFNPVTRIKFSIPRRANVLLKIYDAIGKEVTVPVNGVFNGGIYEAEFNGSQYASGIYFYELYAGNEYTERRKMVLLK